MRPLVKSPASSLPQPGQRTRVLPKLSPPAYEGPLQDWTNAVFRPDLYQLPTLHKSAESVITAQSGGDDAVANEIPLKAGELLTIDAAAAQPLTITVHSEHGGEIAA